MNENFDSALLNNFFFWRVLPLNKNDSHLLKGTQQREGLGKKQWKRDKTIFSRFPIFVFHFSVSFFCSSPFLFGKYFLSPPFPFYPFCLYFSHFSSLLSPLSIFFSFFKKVGRLQNHRAQPPNGKFNKKKHCCSFHFLPRFFCLERFYLGKKALALFLCLRFASFSGIFFILSTQKTAISTFFVCFLSTNSKFFSPETLKRVGKIREAFPFRSNHF